MPEVLWSRSAEARLESISPAAREQLISNAGKILHDITSADFPRDEGYAGTIMWHRGIPCGMLSEELLAQEDDDGPWNYFLLYTPQLPDAEVPDPDRNFQVLDVCSVAEIARRWRNEGEES